MSENAPKKEYKKPSVLAVLKESDGSALSFNYANAVNFLSYGFLHLSLLKNHELANKEPTDITIDDIKHTRFSFPEELVFEAMGYGSSEKTYARKAILKITHALKKMDIGINSKSLVGEFDVNNHNGFTTFVATAAFEDGFLHIETAQTLLYSLLTQERIFTGLVDFHHFKKQYAPNLYQLAMDMIENESKTETEWLAVSTLCDKLGVKTASYRNDGRPA